MSLAPLFSSTSAIQNHAARKYHWTTKKRNNFGDEERNSLKGLLSLCWNERLRPPYMSKIMHSVTNAQQTFIDDEGYEMLESYSTFRQAHPNGSNAHVYVVEFELPKHQVLYKTGQRPKADTKISYISIIKSTYFFHVRLL